MGEDQRERRTGEVVSGGCFCNETMCLPTQMLAAVITSQVYCALCFRCIRSGMKLACYITTMHILP